MNFFAYNQIYHSVIISSFCGNLLELSKGDCLFTKMRQIYQSVMINSCVETNPCPLGIYHSLIMNFLGTVKGTKMRIYHSLMINSHVTCLLKHFFIMWDLW